MKAAALARPCVFCKTDHTGPAVHCSAECAELDSDPELEPFRLTTRQGYLLSRIESGESPFDRAHSTKDTARELERLRRLGCWLWKDPCFPVMRLITPLGYRSLRSWR